MKTIKVNNAAVICFNLWYEAIASNVYNADNKIGNVFFSNELEH